MSDTIEVKGINAFLDCLLKSKYSDLIVLLAVMLAFAMLIVISAALTSKNDSWMAAWLHIAEMLFQPGLYIREAQALLGAA